MKRMLKFIFVVTTFILTYNCYSQNKISNFNVNCAYNFEEIFNNARDFSNKKQSLNLKYKEFRDFSFFDFLPIEGNINPHDYFKIGTNENGDIMEITHYETKSANRLSNFTMSLSHYSKYTIYSLRYLGVDLNNLNTEPSYLAGFFVYIKELKKNYFIGTTKQFWDGGAGMGIEYIDQFPINNFEEISSIINLDSKLRPIEMVRVSNSKIIFGSKFHYDLDIKFTHETIYLFHIPSQNLTNFLTLSKQFCIMETFKKLFDNNIPITYVIPEFMHSGKSLSTPLWYISGKHLYKIKPSEISD